ncbi:uncharacterized protein LOC108193014 isoform X2 [Daucus carota subsp. sativus]|uniref:uncharacterized protein LOC108193014 isoform X2 n=1 Tax=Daucus carota subsp. sativus TaxID=79200 RepID=UPI0007F03B2D|nr:PREDICTED: protein timeless homolog isoform X2 [Daucus carota subsp. sativus]
MEGLSTICAGLGIIDEDDDGNRTGYTPGEYCLDNLKDLLRFLRRDDPQMREVFKQVCKWNIVAKDLIPIIEHCQNDRNLVLNSVKVLVFLTMPVEPGSNDIPQQIEYLWGLKTAISCSDIIAIIVSLLETPLENLESEAFTEDDWKLVQLVLTLFRNLLAVQGVSIQQKLGGSTSQFLSVRDRFLELLFKENVTDLILALTQHVGGPSEYFRQDNLLLLETVHYLLMGQESELVAKAIRKDTQEAGAAEATVSSLQSMMEEEEERRRLIRLQNLGISSQYTGSFTRFTMDGSKTLFKGNPCAASLDALLKTHKNPKGPAKRMAWDHGRLPSTNDNILQLLHEFINQLLSGGYNVLMQSVREDIEKEHPAIQNSDVIVFFKVAQFVTAFQYHKFLGSKPSDEENASEAFTNQSDSTLFQGSICGPIAETMNESMFLLVTSKWRYAFDALKETNEYNFLSAAGSLMRIMIRMLDMVLKQSQEDCMEPQTARILLYKLFYDQTDQGMTQFILNLIKSFDTHKQAKSDLADLIEIIHVIIRLMENLQARGTLRVSKKSRKRKTKKNFKDEKDNANEIVGDHITSQDEIGTSGCAIPPVDSSNTEPTSQANDGKENVSEPLQVNKEHTPNVGENSGSNKQENVSEPFQVDKDDAPEVEAANPGSNMQENVSEPLQVDQEDAPDVEAVDPEGDMPEMEGNNNNGIEDYGADDSSEGEQQLGHLDEVDFKISTLISALANTTIIQRLCWLLKFYKINSSSTNHYIICMLQRICDDLELSPMLYQLSLLTTFHSILVEQKTTPCRGYKNIVDFLTNLVRRMLRKMKASPLLFVEILFWKTRKECHYINCESMLKDLSNMRKDYNKMGQNSTDGADGSFEGRGWNRRSIADALGDDEADDFMPFHVAANQNEENPCTPEGNKFLKRSISNMEEANSDEGSNGKENSKDNQPGRVHKKLKVLGVNDDLDNKMKDLYEKHKGKENCIQLIVEELELDGKISNREVSRKLKQLGFKFPQKRRVLKKGVSDQVREDAKASASEVTHPDLQENSSGRGVLHTRKRVSAFSEEQEGMIISLFEQFKGQKRCSFMIANALDADGSFTAAQVSRKLKQLGLRVPQPKKSSSHLHLRDEEPDDMYDEGFDDADTLSSLRKRTKIKLNTNNGAEGPDEKIVEKVSPEDSDDEPLSSVVGSKTKFHTNDLAERPNQKIAKKVSQEDSDDEPLSTFVGKKTKQKTGNVAESTIQDITRIVSQEDPDDEYLSSIVGSKHEQPTEKGDIANDVSLHIDDDREDEVKFSSRKSPTAGDNQLHYQNLHDELGYQLADFEDDVTPVAPEKHVGSRRKLRMVLDLDDD